MIALDITELTFETHTSGLSLLNSAKCYKPRRPFGGDAASGIRENQVKSSYAPREGLSQGLVLMLAHGTGYHKEHWEPTISHLFDLDLEPANVLGSGPRIREAWAIDIQNHGQAAKLNENVTRERPEAWSIWDYADAFATLRRDILGTDSSYRDNKFVLIAHSASATGVILATTFFPTLSLYPHTFHSLILVEPALVPPEFIDDARHTPLYRSIQKLMGSRKDTWASKDEAKAWMKSRLPWGAWDERVLSCYIEFGLRKPLDLDETKPNSEVVTLMCTRQTESLAYKRGFAQGQPGLWQLNLLCNVNAGKDIGGTKKGMGKPVLPIHVVWGDVDDLFSREVKDSLEDPNQGRVFTSVRRVEDVGHMMVQMAPEATAKALWEIFLESELALKSRL